MNHKLHYYFQYIEHCNMCGDKTLKHKVLGRRLNQSQGSSPKNKIGITTTIVKCNNCGLIYSNPQPVPYSISDHYGVPPESYWTSEYFNISENYFEAEIRKLKSLMLFQPGMRSLDIGAGLGKAMIALEKVGFDSYGFEPSKPFFERAIQKMGINPDRLKLGMIEDLDYPENHFDFISFGAVLEHLYNPADSIAKAMKWLKPTGIIHIEVPSSQWLVNKIINIYYKLRRTDYVANLSPMHIPFHLYEFNIQSFRFHAKKNNYEIASHEYHVCETYLPKILDPIIKPYMKWTNKGMQLTVWLQKK